MDEKDLPNLTGFPNLTGYPITADIQDYVTIKIEDFPVLTNLIKYDAKIEDDTLVLEVDKHTYKERIEIPLKDIFDYLKKEVLK